MMHGCGRYERFQSVSARTGFKENMDWLRPPPQRGRSAYCLDDVNKRSTVLQRRSVSNQSNGLRVMKPVPFAYRIIERSGVARCRC